MTIVWAEQLVLDLPPTPHCISERGGGLSTMCHTWEGEGNPLGSEFAFPGGKGGTPMPALGAEGLELQGGSPWSTLAAEARGGERIGNHDHRIQSF